MSSNGLSFALSVPTIWSTSRMAAVSPHRTALITGASGGIGAATAAGLIRVLPTLETLYLCNRDERKSADTAAAIRESAPHVRIEEIPLDLSALSSVRECARALASKLGSAKKIDVAVFNAGVMACPLKYTKDGLEYQYGVNHLGHALLALSLQHIIQRSVYVSSSAVAISRSRSAPPLVAEKRRGFDEQSYNAWNAYGDSKLAMSMFARGLALDNFDAVSLHPGVVNTELQRHVVPEPLYSWSQRDGAAQKLVRGLSNALGMKTAKQGAQLSIQLASESENIRKGALYVERNREVPRFMAPLLQKDEECRKVVHDVTQYLEKYMVEQENGVPLPLSV